MDNLFNLRGKTALITGSSDGLGLIMAKGFLESGVNVILNGRNSEKLQNVVEILKNEGFSVEGIAFDVSDQTQVISALEEIEKKFPAIDILVNNAGVQKRAPLEEFKIEDWDNILDINLKGAFIVGQAVARKMMRQGGGKIINICSLQSELARPTIAPYAASKGGLRMLTKAMATEWAKYNIQVNGIAPGYFKTEMTKALYENAEFSEWLHKRTPAMRWGEAEELTGTLIYLASNASSFVNGQIIFVDGGITACI